MAKRKATPTPPVPVETPQPVDQPGETLLIHEVTGEPRILSHREGYATPAIPPGFRVATEQERKAVGR